MKLLRRIATVFRRRKTRPEIMGSGNVLIGVPSGFRVRICGEGNTVRFVPPVCSFAGTLTIGAPDCPVSGCEVTVGAGSTSNGTTMWLMESGSSISIGNDCMLSAGVQLWCSDTHSLYDGEGRLTNGGPHRIVIGDHCWIDGGVYMLKDVELPSGCVVGLGAVVGRRASARPGCVLVGNPAVVVREGVTWSRERPQNSKGNAKVRNR